MQKIFAGLLAAVTIAGSIVVAPPADARQRGIWRHGNGGFHAFQGGRRFASPGVYRGRHYGWNQRRYRGGYGRNYGYRNYGYRGYGYRDYDGYDDGDNGVAAGIAGLAAGMVLGGMLNHHHYRAGGSCAARFQSYNSATGTYLGYDGLRHRCP